MNAHMNVDDASLFSTETIIPINKQEWLQKTGEFKSQFWDITPQLWMTAKQDMSVLSDEIRMYNKRN